MDTGIFSQQRNSPKNGFPIIGTVVCLAAAFMLGWFAHACISISSANTGVTIHEPLFSPNGGARGTIHTRIDQAESEILVALYYFTDPILAEALIEAKERGVTVSVLLDRSQRKGKSSQAGRLMDGGVAVAFDAKRRIMHHKFMVVDGRIVVTGSQNWTKSAETVNAENTLIFADSPELAARYKEEFMRLLKPSDPGRIG